jgi:hypothetical protein
MPWLVSGSFEGKGSKEEMTNADKATLTLPMLARGRAPASLTNADDAANWLIQNNAARAARILKAPVPASSTTNNDVAVIIAAWTSSMASASVFYKLLNDGLFRKLPPHVRIALATSSPTAGIVLEGRAAPISRVVIEHTVLQPVTVVSMLVATRELLLEPGAEGLFVKELRSVLAQSVDAALVGILFDGTTATTIPSSGTSPAAAVADLRAALLALGPVGEASRLVALASTNVAMMAATLGGEGGGTFPGMTPAGGQLRGLNCLVSNGIPAGQLAVLDAAQVAAAATEVDVQVSTEADLEMSDAPVSDSTVPTGASMVSMRDGRGSQHHERRLYPIIKIIPCATIEHGRSPQIVQRLLALHRTFGMRIQKAAVPRGVRPSDRDKAGRAGLDVLPVDIGTGLTPLGGALKPSNAFRPREQPCLRAPRHIAGDLEQLHEVGDLVDLVDLAFHQRDAFCGLAGENRYPFVGRCDRHLLGQFATRRIRARARLFRSASWRASPPSPRSRASISNSRQAATRAVPDCFGSDAIFHRIARTCSGVSATVKQTSGSGECRVAVAFFVILSS